MNAVISIKYLGENLDIHCGGVDNIFPHHTNEIAQSESYLGHKWCNYWFHSEHLNDITGKMSKSKGEFLTISLLEEKGYDPIVYRFYVLKSHYRKQLLFTYENLDAAVNDYNKLKNRISNIDKNDGEILEDKIKIYKDKFVRELEKDLNTANAITVLYDVLKSDLNGASKIYLIEDFDKVLSLNLLKEQQIDSDLEKYIENMIAKRKEAKANKDFKLADEIREELLSKNVVLKDTKEGTLYEIKNT